MTPAERAHDFHDRPIPLPTISPVHRDSNTDVCPWCDQPIPPERAEEISGRIRARERQRIDEVSRELRDEFARDQAEAQAAAQSLLQEAKAAGETALAQARQEAAEREESIREQVRQEAEAQLADAKRERIEAESTWRSQLAQAQQERSVADEERRGLASQLAELRITGEAALRQVREEAALSEENIRAEVTGAAEVQIATKVAEAVRSNSEKVSELTSALEEATHQRTAAEEARRALEQQTEALAEEHSTALIQAVQETREAADRDKDLAIRTERSKHFEEIQKAQVLVHDLQRKLERKTSEELGEGAEVDLFEALKNEFPDDLITQVPRGVSGPDIIHDVRVNAQVCGRIVYDAKNRNAWKNEYATKLHADQIAAEADHAVLSSNKFPAGARQLHLFEGVLVACPARVLAVAQLLRHHVLQTHQLRVSNEQREGKTAQLYAFITSERYSQLFESVNALVEKVEEIDTNELRSHRAVWEKRGRAMKAIAQAQGNLQFEINKIIGTASTPEGAE